MTSMQAQDMPNQNVTPDEALRAALRRGNIHAIDQALANGASPAILVDNPFLPGSQQIYPAIISAAAYGSLHTIRLLLRAGADFNAVAANGIDVNQAMAMGAHPEHAAEMERLQQEFQQNQSDNRHLMAKNATRPWLKPPAPKPPWATS